MTSTVRGAALTVLVAVVLPVDSSAVMLAKNPIRKVVNMLQAIKDKVTKEGEEEEKAFKEFMCYCKTGVGTLEQQIEDSRTKIDTLESQLKESTEKQKMTDESLKGHQTSREDAKDTIGKATAIREEENRAYDKEKEDYETNIAAIKAAVAALEKGVGQSFLQSKSAQMISRFVMEKANIDDSSRQQLLVFLSGQSGDTYAPQSGQIIGILKQMGDEMARALEEADDAEKEAKTVFDQMCGAKTREIVTLTEQIEEEMMRLGELNVMLAEGQNDLEDTKETLAEDIRYLAELKKGCKTKEAEWEQRCKVRAEELVALSETIKVLNDDDALELFKKTLPGASAASFLQIKATSKDVRTKALHLLRRSKKKRHSPQLDIVMLALQGKKIAFDEVIKLIDDMIATLKKEQIEDDKKKSYCEAEIDKREDEQKELEHSIEVSKTAMQELEGSIATTKDDIKALEASIAKLDASVAEATALRKEQNAEFKALRQENTDAKEVLRWARNRLNKFYNPKLYKEDDDFESNLPFEDLSQVKAHGRRSDAAPPPPPETFGAYTKKSEESGGVIEMITKIITDIDATVAEATQEEKDSQEDYLKLMADAGDKRTADAKALTEKGAALAEAEEALQAETEKKEGMDEELMETIRLLTNVHAECDWLLKYFDVRRAARGDEMDALVKAKDVLNGADYSL